MALAIGQWVRCTLDGKTEHRAQIVAMESDEVVDVAIYNDAGQILKGVAGLVLAKGLDRSAPIFGGRNPI